MVWVHRQVLHHDRVRLRLIQYIAAGYPSLQIGQRGEGNQVPAQGGAIPLPGGEDPMKIPQRLQRPGGIDVDRGRQGRPGLIYRRVSL